MSFVATKAKIGFGSSFSYSTNLVTPVLHGAGGDHQHHAGQAQGGEGRGVADGQQRPRERPAHRGQHPRLGRPRRVDVQVRLRLRRHRRRAIFALLGTEILGKVLRPDTKGYTFQGYISEFGDEIPLKDRMTIEIKVTINGGSVMTAI
jgi:hypothetical protein